MATLGPASRSSIADLIRAGVDVFRLNCAHATVGELRAMVRDVRRAARDAAAPVGILADLQGPKIRTGRLQGGGPILVKRGEEVLIDTRPGTAGRQGRPTRIGTSYRRLCRDVRPHDRVLLDDGVMELRVLAVEGPVVRTRVVYGGVLHEFKGINLPGSPISARGLSRRDLEDLAAVCEAGVDFVAMSFVRSAGDIRSLRERANRLGCSPWIVAKIERPEAVADLSAILDEADALMVARGDLGVEIGAAAVPPVQKKVIRACVLARKPVITATQMLESMVANPRPTRAEASDVANAIYDGTSAVMLSAETATGRYPVRAVRTMERIARAAEADLYGGGRGPLLAEPSDSVAVSTVRAAVRAAEESRADLIAVYTETGRTANLLAAERPPTRVVALSPSPETVRRMCLTFGVLPLRIPSCRSAGAMIRSGDRILRERGLVRAGERIVQVAGTFRQAGLTNSLCIRDL
ncbi:MAG: pyruvate kinase [Planctomycetota bacterium]